MVDLRNRLEDTCKLVKENLEATAVRNKHHYDKRARVRSLEVGDKVLILLPTRTSKLFLNWKGPYEVCEKVSDYDYRIKFVDG